MCIYQSTKSFPYVYMCTHTITGQFYIGYREQNVKVNKPSTVDFPLYKTSSTKVKPIFHEFTWTILAEFFDGESAYDFEQQLIFEHWGNPLLLNKTCHYGKQRFKGIKGIVITAEQRSKLSSAMIGHPVLESSRSNISMSLRKDKNPIIIFGQTYISYSEASRALGMPRNQIRKLLKPG